MDGCEMSVSGKIGRRVPVPLSLPAWLRRGQGVGEQREATRVVKRANGDVDRSVGRVVDVVTVPRATIVL